jgi:integrase
MPDQLPSGRWRGRIRHPRTGKHVNPAKILGGGPTYPTSAAAAAAESEALRLLRSNVRLGITVREWWEEWTTDPLWARPAESTNINNAERTGAFVRSHGNLPMRAVDHEVVAAWIRGGKNLSTVDKLRTMWSDACSPTAGKLVDDNPWKGLRIPRRTKKDRRPPGIDGIARMLQVADEITPPSFADWLALGCYEAFRPGETDALKWSKLDFQAEEILVDEQWNATSQKFTEPKHHHVRRIGMVAPAKERLLKAVRESEFVCTTLRGSHYRPSSRAFHWNRVRIASGLPHNMDCYVATRHYFGWYALNVLELKDHVIALHLGHRDGGKLVRETYGHPDDEIARQKIRAAFRAAPAPPIPLRRAI